MGIDLEKLAPAEDWQCTVDSDCHEDHSKGTEFWGCTEARGTREEAAIDARFCDIARYAVDVRLRRGWYCAFSEGGWYLCGPKTCDLPYRFLSRQDNPVDADGNMVDADVWVKENIEKGA